MEIFILSLTFFILIIAGFSTYFAIQGNHKLYWLAGVTIYLFSFLTSFTIGLFTVGLSFVAFSFAIAYHFNWIQSRLSFVSFLSIGIIIGFLIVYYVPDYIFIF